MHSLDGGFGARLFGRLVGAVEWLGARSRLSLYASVTAVIVAGGGYCLAIGPTLRFADERDYLTLAENLRQEGVFSADGINPTAFRPPGYPVLLGGLLRVGVPESALRLSNVLFMVVVVAAAWWLARRVGGARAAALAAPFTALYPITFFTMGALVPQPMGAALLMTGVVAVVVVAGRNRIWLPATVGGLAFGLLVLTIPTFGFTFLVALVWLAWRRRIWKAALVMAAAALVLPGLWFVRNLNEMGGRVLVATNGGFNLLLGNSELAGPRTGSMTDISKYQLVAEERGLDEVATDRYYQESALRWMGSHPVRAAVLYVEKTANYFAPYDRLAAADESGTLRQVVAVATYTPLLVIFVARLVAWRRRRPSSIEVLLITVYLSAAPIQAIFFTRVRFRAPLDPILIVMVACALAAWCTPASEIAPEAVDVRS